MKNSLFFLLSLVVVCSSGGFATENTIIKGTGQWSGWFQGRSDYGYLPNTENVESGVKGFHVYYRCSEFSMDGDSVLWNIEFDNDKGGEFGGLVSWEKSPTEGRSIKFELSSKNGTAASVEALNEIGNKDALCGALYKSIESGRSIVSGYLLKKDRKSVAAVYSGGKYIPGPVGLASAGMEIVADLAIGEPKSALYYIMNAYVLGIANALILIEKVAVIPLVVKTDAVMVGYSLLIPKLSNDNPKKDNDMQPDFDGAVAVSLPQYQPMLFSYSQSYENFKNIFFGKWR